MSQEKESGFVIQLEEPPNEASAAGEPLGALFADESMVLTTAKLSALESLLGLLTRDLKFTDFMREVLLVFLRVIKCEAGSILEVDHSGQCLFFRATAGRVSEQLPSFKVPLAKGIAGHVFESKQPLVVTNVQENQKFLRAIQDAVGFETRNMVAIPILVRGRVFGILELLNRVGEDQFSDEDLEFLTQLCGFAAKAIEVRLMLGWALEKARSGNDSRAGPKKEAA